MKKPNNSNEKTHEKNSQIERFRRRQNKKVVARIRKNTSDTFWNLLRKENGLTYKDVSEYTGYSETRICSWFIGRLMPGHVQIEAFCKMFDVDFTTGKEGFEQGYDIYHNTKTKTANIPARKANDMMVNQVAKYVATDDTTFEPEESEDTKVIEPEIECTECETTSIVEAPASKFRQILFVLYRYLSLDDFVALYDGHKFGEEPREILGKLIQEGKIKDFDVLAKLFNIVNS